MDDFDQILAATRRLLRPDRRTVVAIAGPPAAGKSTFADRLAARCNEEIEPDIAAVLAMDGYHYDNAVIEPRGQFRRKGAPETFDVNGYLTMLSMVRERPDEELAVPVFDRDLDLARAGAGIIGPKQRVVVTEGNYLLLERPPWSRLALLFDLTVYLDVDIAELEKRMMERWLGYGLSPQAARERAEGNDLANARLVIEASRPADFTIRQ